MPHQCLKCGKVFPSGSPEILKGCSDCGGKKFFYTEQAVSEAERKHLVEQANKDIKVLIREILSQSQRDQLKTYDSEGHEVSATSSASSDWVKITPTEGVPEVSTSPKPSTSAPVTATTATPITKPMPKHSTVKKILQQLKQKPELGMDLPDSETAVPDKNIDTKPAMTRPRKKGKIKLKRKLGKKKQMARPEVISMKEPGVYDIYLSKLLKGFPIIINRDGTYLVHLPSIFESIDKDRDKRD